MLSWLAKHIWGFYFFLCLDCPLCAQTFCLSEVTECAIFEDDSNNNKAPKVRVRILWKKVMIMNKMVHSSGGEKIVLKVIATISSLCVFIVIYVVWTGLPYSFRNRTIIKTL